MHSETVMKKWLTGGAGSILMVLTWTVGWGLGFGGLMELYDPHGAIGDVWPTALAIPGFIGGVVFSALLRMVEGVRGMDEVPFARMTAWGVVTGLVLGGAAVAAEINLSPARALGIASALGAVAAFGSAVFFRLLARWRMPPAAGRTA